MRENKFKKFWQQYRAIIIILLSAGGISAPIATGIVSLGDAVAVEASAPDAAGN